MAVKEYHHADEVILTEWKKGKALCCYRLSDMKTVVPASKIFGEVPSKRKLDKKIESNGPEKPT